MDQSPTTRSNSTVPAPTPASSTPTASPALVPSQAVSSRNRAGRNTNRRKGQQKPQDGQSAQSQGGAAASTTDETKPIQPGKKGNNRRKKNKNNGKNAPPNQRGEAANEQPSQAPSNESRNQGQKRGRNRRQKQKKRYPWRRHIPQGTVDPITLDALVGLEYPPFALANTPPYVPVKVWPLPSQEEQKKPAAVTVEELNRRRIEEQWGGKSLGGGDRQEEQKDEVSTDQQHHHLYDGRALAYYLVSQLQFIDPLNRRDLTRDELVNLDEYLKRHGFTDIRVTEAYDAKGITISSAGAAASTARGRSEILQQMAQVLLNSIFGAQQGLPTSPLQMANVASNQSSTDQETSLQDQYAELQRREQLETQRRQQSSSLSQGNDYSYYASEDGGLVVIDDDENPGLRGGGLSQPGRPETQTQGTGPLYSASHIANLHGQGAISQGSGSFPALARPSLPEPPPAAAKKPAKPSATLNRITSAVKKTRPEETQKQWEAREEARKRAMLASLRLGVDPTTALNNVRGVGLSQPPPAVAVAGQALPSEEKLQRNRALAEALGVSPATKRQYNSGWARPTGENTSLDEYGNELNAAIYPDTLILQARERMSLVTKIEKKWKSFLADDTAASLPLNAMDRPTRTFVHEYSDFWKLRTESFDPEPRRYIHCVKMLDTRTPSPLLSEAARSWRGPQQQLQYATAKLASLSSSDHTSQQTPGQNTLSREIPPPPDRVPLPLKSRSVLPREDANVIAAGNSGKAAQSFADPELNSRFGGLFTGRERPKLELAKRTVPLELPPFQPPVKGYNVAEVHEQEQSRLEEKARKEREAEQRKRQALEDAFASDDEEASHRSSEWGEEQEAVYRSDSETDDW